MINRFKYLITVFFLLTVSELFFASAQIELEPIGNYQSGVFDKSVAEVVAHAPETQRLFVSNASSGNVDILNISSPSTPTKLFTIDATSHGKGANSIAFSNGIASRPETSP